MMNTPENALNLFDHLYELAPGMATEIKNFILKTFNYQPKIGIFGKTGVGKSSLCNALFGENVALVSPIYPCTREAQGYLVGAGSENIKLIDFPGVGENRERDMEYKALYSKHLPDIDVVLWVLKADDRAFSTDEEFYHNVLKPHLEQGKPFIIVLNQIDKVEPYSEWDRKNRFYGTEQQKNIDDKIKVVAEKFRIDRKNVIPVSCADKYNLVTLAETITSAIPKEKKVTFVNSVKDENRSEKAKEEAKKGFFEGLLGETITSAIPKEKKVTFVNSVKDENRSEKAKEEAKRVFFEGLPVATITSAISKEKEVTFVNSVKDENRSDKTKEEAKKGLFEGLGEKLGKSIAGDSGKNIGKTIGKLFDNPILQIAVIGDKLRKRGNCQAWCLQWSKIV